MNTENTNTIPSQIPVSDTPNISYEKIFGMSGSDKPEPAPIAEKKAELTPGEKEQAKPATVSKEEVKPEVKPDDTAVKANIAFIKMRQEKAALKKRIAELEAKPSAAMGAHAEAPTDRETIKAELLAEIKRSEEEKAFQARIAEKQDKAMNILATDSEISSTPTGVVDVLEMIDKDVRLARLSEIDPELAMMEATKVWKEQHGLSTTVAPTSPSGRVVASHENISALEEKLDKLKPGTKEWNKVYKQWNELRK